MKIRPLAVGALALVLPLAAVACGGEDDNNSGTRPTVAELKTQILKEVSIPANTPGADDFGDCAAKGIHESNVPNGVLRKLVKGEEAKVDKDNKGDYEKTMNDVITGCINEHLTGAAE